ncbi:protein LZIC [Fopius arisanus]|uniref:Lzic protein n=1 Tax=Fopius arisanus TaxID=64838 RepID=A0A0C9QM33_9HYME|nr:PREDICTED: protein LZIC-like [Fopius arisanus]XP_011306515.1 PREDICTED: protein LZIC-like [Fopius arisanus]
MSSHGKVETERLRKNLEEQLDRLVQQLEDLEECKEDLEESDYEETKRETMDQLREFSDSLQRMISGDMTLVDQLGAMQLATHAAVSAAFKTPAVIRMFGRREPKQLRERLSIIERDTRLGKLSKEMSDRQRSEILSALKQLGEKLQQSELEFLEKLSMDTVDVTGFIKVSDNQEKCQMALAMASQEVNATQNT